MDRVFKARCVEGVVDLCVISIYVVFDILDFGKNGLRGVVYIINRSGSSNSSLDSAFLMTLLQILLYEKKLLPKRATDARTA